MVKIRFLQEIIEKTNLEELKKDTAAILSAVSFLLFTNGGDAGFGGVFLFSPPLFTNGSKPRDKCALLPETCSALRCKKSDPEQGCYQLHPIPKYFLIFPTHFSRATFPSISEYVEPCSKDQGANLLLIKHYRRFAQ